MADHSLQDDSIAPDGHQSALPLNDQQDSKRTDRSPSPPELDTAIKAPHASATRGNTHRKPPLKHVAGQSRLGSRTMSSGRNLNKTINLGPAAALRDDGGPQTATARISYTSAPMMSPRHRQQVKRSSTSSVNLNKSTSSSNLLRNASNTHLTKIAQRPSSRHQQSGSHATRPDFHRSQSQPNRLQEADAANGASNNTRQPAAAVHFDIGDEDEETGEMEGVDDGWTDSASPCTTRDNTRSNTRSNSMTSEVREFKMLREDMPRDKLSALTSAVGASISGPREPVSSNTGSATASPQKPNMTGPSQEIPATALQPPSADAIARRLLQRGQRPNSAPKVSEILALGNGAAAQLEDIYPSISTGSSGGSGSGPRISRFISEQSGGSSAGAKILEQETPVSTQGPSSRTPPDNEEDLDDVHRDPSNSHLATQFPQLTHNSSANSTAPSSGYHTPGVAAIIASRPSRTQQKLWLQRGLSHIEATTQEQAIALGNFQAGGVVALLKQLDKVEKEYKVVRRFHDPIQESIERLRKHSTRPGSLAELHTKDGTVSVNGSWKPGTGASTPQTQARAARLLSGARTPAADSFRSLSGSNTLSNSGGSTRNSLTMTGRSAVNMGLPPHIEENDSASRSGADEHGQDLPPPDWYSMSLEELEVQTRDIRRRMWELTQPVDDET